MSIRLLFTGLVRLITALIVLGLFGAGLIYYLASRSLPDYSQTITVKGITAPVEIVRGTGAIPHIFGATDEDVYFGLGLAQAQDRLWQMTMLRRTVQGRLSEIFGPRTLKTDTLMRQLDLYRLAEKAVAVQDPATQRALTAYAAGVNAWIEQVNKRALGRGAPEFFLFPPKIAPWRPADSLAILKLMGLQLTDQAADEVLRARVALAVSPERLKDLLPDPPGAVAALKKFASLFPQGPMPDAHAELSQAPLSPFPAPGMAGASNAWAAGPSRSATGHSLLANDPHLPLTAPSIWYLAQLGLPEGGVIGGTIPGVPLVLLGRNKDLAWGVTTAYADDQDLYLEEVDPQDPDKYRTADGFAAFREEPSIIQVKGQPSQTVTLRWTQNGPVMPGSLYDMASITPPGYVMSMAWTLLTADDTTMSAARAIMTASSVKDAMADGKGIVAPAQVLTLADRDNIGMQVAGALPKRDPASDSQGRLPSFGWIAHNRWDGTLPYADNPSFYDPEGGILGNTNNQMTDRPYPYNVSFNWGDTQRIQRWAKLMQEREKHSVASFSEAQLDTVSVTARTLLPLVAKDLWYTGPAAPEGTEEARRQTALRLLANWNGEMNEHMPEPLIYMAWMRALQARLITDDLGGELAAEFTHVDPIFIERVFRNIDGASAWCDIKQSKQIETCDQIASMALDDALVWIGEHYKGTLESLQWGQAHIAVQDHQALGQIPGLKWFVNIHQSTSGGDNTLMRGLTRGTGPDPFLNVHAASYRGVYDLGDPDASEFIISTGESGNPMSSHYDDLGELWRRGEYIPMSLDPEQARAGALGVTKLEPEPAEDD